MCQFIETIGVRWGKVQHLAYHQERMNRSRREVLGLSDTLALAEFLQIPRHLQQVAWVKCRVLYAATAEEVSFTEYQPRVVRSLRLVRHDTIQYSYKFANRDLIDQLFAQRGDCDDVLIVKQGYLTDTSYCNIAFYDGHRWVTPERPLLAGTCRARLLVEGVLQEMKLTPADLMHFSHGSLINAMLPLGKLIVPTARIYE